MKYEDQTLAVYPANLAPAPLPSPSPMDREDGIKAYQNMVTAKEYKARLERGDNNELAHEFKIPPGPAPVFPVIVSKVEQMTAEVTKYEFSKPDGTPLPQFDAGAHIDVVVAPEYFRQFSLSGNPDDRSSYQIAVLREEDGRGGSKLMHQIFTERRKIFISPPRNHFPLEENADKSYLMGGGIGITPIPLPQFDAGAHIDVVVAPEYFRQFSLSGNPDDRSSYQIAVLREEDGRGGSKLMHQIFTERRKIFISPPRNHFPLEENADKSYLMGGGIGITPMIAMAHRLHSLGKDFEVHYSCKSRDLAGFMADLGKVPWADKVHFHFSDEDSRVDLDQLFQDAPQDYHIYVCGPDRFMAAVLEAGEKAGYDEDNLHREYFTVPETPDKINYDFRLKLAKSGQEILVPADKTATEALAEAGIPVDVKCSDGLCGVCACDLLDGAVDHRDFVLSKKARTEKIILCSSRSAEENGVVTINL